MLAFQWYQPMTFITVCLAKYPAMCADHQGEAERCNPVLQREVTILIPALGRSLVALAVVRNKGTLHHTAGREAGRLSHRL